MGLEEITSYKWVIEGEDVYKRQTVECVGEISKNQHIGVLATAGTIKSESYPLEIHKLFPEIQVSADDFSSRLSHPGYAVHSRPDRMPCGTLRPTVHFLSTAGASA